MDPLCFDSPAIFSKEITHVSAFFNAEEILRSNPLFIPKYSKGRKAEFIAGRICAKLALKNLDIEVKNILSNIDRSPIWPEGIIGSITHTNDFVSVAIASGKSLSSLGLDSEYLFKLEEALEIEDLVLNNIEQKSSSHMKKEEFITLAYSAKESLFKALFPLCQTFFSFQDAQLISINKGDQSFKIQLKKTLSSVLLKDLIFEGQYLVKDNLVHTGMEIPKIFTKSLNHLENLPSI